MPDILVRVRSETLRHLRNHYNFTTAVCLFILSNGLAGNSQLLELAFYDMNLDPNIRLSCYEDKTTL